jgi:hypothetical protein
MWRRYCCPVLVLATALLAGWSSCLARACHDEEEVEFTVVPVLASEKDPTINPKLKDFAKEVQKKWPKFVGFKMGCCTRKSVEVGKEEKISLIDDQIIVVTVLHGCDKRGRVGLRVKVPGTEVTYETCCGKYFPIMTDYQTKKKEQLLIAIQVRPCGDKK